MNRDRLRRAFLQRHGVGDAPLTPLTPDASFRRYARLRCADGTMMLMDAPPPESVDAFVKVTRHLQKIGARVPVVHGVDGDHGFLLLEDLGDDTFAKLLAGGHDETALYRHAINALAAIHRHPRAAAVKLPTYDADLALTEANLFCDWYLPARLQRPVGAAACESFADGWTTMLRALPTLTPTLVLRDFHIDNLMLTGGECALLDYQDAVIGSPAYDLVSLLEDARRDIGGGLTDAMMNLYCEQNPLDRGELNQHCMVWGAQRHCKVAGIFVRLWLRDGKDVYLKHLPRVMKLLQRHLHQPPLAPLADWLADFGDLNHADFTAPAAALRRHCGAQ